MTQSSQTAARQTARTQGIALPADEVERREALIRYGILDTGAEHSFDDLARLAAHVCNASIALITFIDEDRSGSNPKWV